MDPNISIDQLVPLAQAFDRRLETLKAGCGKINWYPYPTLRAVTHLDKLLSGTRRNLLALAGSLPVADIACADGDLSFFLESQGLRVHAIDWPDCNYNRMTGVGTLRSALCSEVEIHVLDLDREFHLPAPRYGLAFFLGALYHLKNPFQALETLSRQVRYLVLNTRIAARTPGGLRMCEEPIAYLLDETECNHDASNFWIFSETGLRRLLRRAGWNVLDFTVLGDSANAEPARLDADARAFALAVSPLAYLEEGPLLIDGWYGLDAGCWRWTGRRFSIELALPSPGRDVELQFYFQVHPASIQCLGPVTLSARANRALLQPRTCSEAGVHCYRSSFWAEGRVRIEFELDRALPPGGGDLRELGLLVCFDRYIADDGRPQAGPIAII